MPHPDLPPAPTSSPPRAPRLRLVACFKGAGWRYSFDDGDGVEVWLGPAHVGTLPASLLFQVVRHYVQGAAIQEAVTAALTPPPSGLAPRLPAATGRRLRGRPA